MITLSGWETPREAAEALPDAGLAAVPWDDRHLRISSANASDKLAAWTAWKRPLCGDGTSVAEMSRRFPAFFRRSPALPHVSTDLSAT